MRPVEEGAQSKKPRSLTHVLIMTAMSASSAASSASNVVMPLSFARASLETAFLLAPRAFLNAVGERLRRLAVILDGLDFSGMAWTHQGNELCLDLGDEVGPETVETDELADQVLGVYPHCEREYAWYFVNSSSRTHSVGQKKSNCFGLYDMYGNVGEWCEDWYHDSYAGAPTDGSPWVAGGDEHHRVFRGGWWYLDADRSRSAFRFGFDPTVRGNNYGFRVAFRPQ
jgi:hypothetical protein